MIPNVKMWVGDMEVEHAAQDQLRNMAKLPILAGHIAIMPDVHMGIGATVGSVIPTKAAIIPSAVGVDIGCGMIAIHTNLTSKDLPDSLARIRSDIEAAIPVGFNMHNDPVKLTKDGLPGMALNGRRDFLRRQFGELKINAVIGKQDLTKLWKQAGTLGGGNHFIELCLAEDDHVWVMLHSGSRNIGKLIGEAAINMAKELMEKNGVAIADKNLAWLAEGSPEFDMYTEALEWAQRYAALNRDIMLHLTMKVLAKTFPDIRGIEDAVNCHHNFAAREEHYGAQVWITRKGAVRARNGELGIIPGSMGARSFIVRGKGHEEAYCSCSHGAGRKMSRGAAKKLFNEADLAAQTAGVECRKDSGVVDEIPGAYKDIDQVMAAQAELVEIVHTLKQVLCVKG